MKDGTKLIYVNKWNEYDMKIDFIKTVNEKSYSLEHGSKINKETMMNKWKHIYTIPTQEQLDFIDKNNKKELLTKIALDFNYELKDAISILDTLSKHSDLLELSSDAVEDIECCIELLKVNLEEETK